VLLIPIISSGKTANYWSCNFNEESSFLFGIVVVSGGGASAIFYNIANIGYNWIISEKVMILSGLRTDFSTTKNLNYTPYDQNKTINDFELDKYHLTYGLAIKILEHDFITKQLYYRT